MSLLHPNRDGMRFDKAYGIYHSVKPSLIHDAKVIIYNAMFSWHIIMSMMGHGLHHGFCNVLYALLC